MKTLTSTEFDALNWQVEQEQNDEILFYPDNDDELFCRYNSYKEIFLDRNFNPTGEQTEHLQRLLANKMEEESEFTVFDGYSEYGIEERDFLSC